jgi:hypothetical protein
MCAVTPPLANKFWLSSTLTLPGLPRSWHGSSAARTRKALTTPTEPPVRNVSIGRGATASPRSVFSKATNASPGKPQRAGSDEKASKTSVSTRYASAAILLFTNVNGRDARKIQLVAGEQVHARKRASSFLYPCSSPIGDDVSPSTRRRRRRKNLNPANRHPGGANRPSQHDARVAIASLPGSQSAAKSGSQSAADRIAIRPRIASGTG